MREVVSRPNMRFVSPKSIEQQLQVLVHRARQGFVQQRTTTINRIRGLLSEFGIVLPLKAAMPLKPWLSTTAGMPKRQDL